MKAQSLFLSAFASLFFLSCSSTKTMRDGTAFNFERYKGRLGLPVDSGIISDHFGQHPSTLAQQVMINNPGIDIRTAENARVMAVFQGRVSSVFSTVGASQIVIIDHGNYYTVYNGLENVSVKKDQQVAEKEIIGTVAPNDQGEPVINFQIWKSNASSKKSQTNLDPEQWLNKM